MSTAAAPPLMTAEDLLAMPDDGVERWLIRGQLREKSGGKLMTVRNRFHSRVMVLVAAILEEWRQHQPEPRGEVLCGEAGVILKRNPDTIVGIDVVYISAQIAAQTPKDTTLVDGVPTLAVEILSPSDTHEEVREKVAGYLQAGVPLVWVVDPDDRAVRIYRPGVRLEVVNEDHELSGEPHLPGFRVPVRRLFE
jgi:Uma2 family endonuclease